MDQGTCVAERVEAPTASHQAPYECITEQQAKTFRSLDPEEQALICRKLGLCGMCKTVWQDAFS